tara:strand:+ start:2454 stop:6371 length:3918 start_codon:yes stop_codon:yes gene_type:complete
MSLRRQNIRSNPRLGEVDASILRRIEQSKSQPATQPTQTWAEYVADQINNPPQVDASITREKTQQEKIIEMLQQSNKQASSQASKMQAFRQAEAKSMKTVKSRDQQIKDLQAVQNRNINAREADRLKKLVMEELSLPNSLSNPKKAGELITSGYGKETKRVYWDGKLKGHDWAKHGFNGVGDTSDNAHTVRPQLMVDSMGCYAMCMAHYRADYDSEGEFNGWVPMRKNETIAAGTPMCSVMQFFVKPVKTGLPGGQPFYIEDPFYLEGHNTPKWQHASGMKLDPTDFFFLEPELARDGTIDVINQKHWAAGGVFDFVEEDTFEATRTQGMNGLGFSKLWDATGGKLIDATVDTGQAIWSGGEAIVEGTIDAGMTVVEAVSEIEMDDIIDATKETLEFTLNAIPTQITKGDRESAANDGVIRGKRSASKTLDRDFPNSVASISNKGIKQGRLDKNQFACKLQWYDGSGWSPYTKFPTRIPMADEVGKTMVIYRFPRQLDPNDDSVLLKSIAEAGGPDYSIDATKHCYPYPSTKNESGESGYALLGRLQPNGSNDPSWTAPKYEVNKNGIIYGARRKIDLIPMVSPRTHPRAGYRTNINEVAEAILNDYDVYSKLGIDSLDRATLFRAIGRFCFNPEPAKLGVSVTDPQKLTYFNNPEINGTFFLRNDLKPGSTFFVIGQGLTSYDSLDSQIRNGEVHSSERINLSLSTKRKHDEMLKANPPIRSYQIEDDRPTDGSLAGTMTADFLVPSAVMTTLDLANGETPPGSETIKDTFRRITRSQEHPQGRELTPELFKEMKLNHTMLGSNSTRNVNNKLFYTVKGDYGTFSYPYSIAGFTIPPYWKGPTMEFDEAGQLVTSKAGSIKSGDTVWFNYYPPFGSEIAKRVENFDVRVTTQKGGFDETTGDATVVADPMSLVTSSDTFEALEQEFGDASVDVTQEYLDDEITEVEEKVEENIMLDRYGSKRFVVPGSYENYFLFGKKYMTGREIIESGGQIPMPTPTNVSGLGSLRAGVDYEINDVTQKWGSIGNYGGSEVVGDTRMQFPKPYSDVQGEQLGYSAFGALEWFDDNQGNLGSQPIRLPVLDCPPATQNLALNTKNRNSAIKTPYIQYGPLNLSDEQYWVRAAKHWNTTPDVAKNSKCSNCVAFDISPRMLDCMPGAVQEDGILGYCWMHHFKCHSARTCYTWASGGPISEDKVSHDWQTRSGISGINGIGEPMGGLGDIHSDLPKWGETIGKTGGNLTSEFIEAQSVESLAKGAAIIIPVAALAAFTLPAGIGWGVGTMVSKPITAFSKSIGNAIGSVKKGMRA